MHGPQRLEKEVSTLYKAYRTNVMSRTLYFIFGSYCMNIHINVRIQGPWQNGKISSVATWRS